MYIWNPHKPANALFVPHGGLAQAQRKDVPVKGHFGRQTY